MVWEPYSFHLKKVGKKIEDEDDDNDGKKEKRDVMIYFLTLVVDQEDDEDAQESVTWIVLLMDSFVLCVIVFLFLSVFLVLNKKYFFRNWYRRGFNVFLSLLKDPW